MYSEAEHDIKKKQMLEKSLELFVKQGLENTSMNDLARHSNVYKAAFYTYFKSKDEIVIECAKIYMMGLGSRLFEGIKTSGTDLMGALNRGFEILADERQKMRFVYQVVASPKYGEISRRELVPIYSKYLDYSEIIADFFKIDKEKFRSIYLLLVATIHDFCLWENEKFVNEKLQYIYSQIDILTKESN